MNLICPQDRYKSWRYHFLRPPLLVTAPKFYQPFVKHQKMTNQAGRCQGDEGWDRSKDLHNDWVRAFEREDFYDCTFRLESKQGEKKVEFYYKWYFYGSNVHCWHIKLIKMYFISSKVLILRIIIIISAFVLSLPRNSSATDCCCPSRAASSPKCFLATSKKRAWARTSPFHCTESPLRRLNAPWSR